MRSEPNGWLSESTPATLAANMIAGLGQLLKADDYAREVQRPGWDFAVEIASLHAAGLTNSDLRWLVCKGYVEHAVETTLAGSEARTYEREGRLTFSPGTCFVLTPGGAAFMRQPAPPAAAGPEPTNRGADGKGPAPPGIPHWDAACRVLCVGGKVVKQFRVPAANQELILAAFEELGWPPHLDDPLPPVADLECKRRLRDTTSRLNHNQRHRLIRFHGDGSGRGLRWELLW
jgi:hypothetical protein